MQDHSHRVDSTHRQHLTENNSVAGSGKCIEYQSFVHQSSAYQELAQRIEAQREAIALRQQAHETAAALRGSVELEQLEEQLAALKATFFQLDEVFTQIEDDTPRLSQARTHFYAGRSREACLALDAAAMTRDRDRLSTCEQTAASVDPAIASERRRLAQEYVVKAWLQTVVSDRADCFEQARTDFETAIAIARTQLTLFEYALFLHNHGYLDEAQPCYQGFLDRYVAPAVEYPHRYLPRVAMAFNNLANVQAAQGAVAAALDSYAAAVEQYRHLAETDWRTYLPYVAMTLTNLATLQWSQADVVSAQANYEAALAPYRMLAIEAPRRYLPYVAMTLNNLANVQLSEQNVVNAEANYGSALHTYRRLAAAEPDNYAADVAMALNNLALTQSARGDSGAAQNNYEEALQRYRGLADDHPWRYLPNVANGLNNLANLQVDCGDLAIAQAHYAAASQIYRLLAEVDAPVYLPELASVLNSLANVQSALGDLAPAQENYEAALQIGRQLATADAAVHGLDLAMTLINLSLFYLETQLDCSRSRTLAIEARYILQSQPDAAAIAPYLQLTHEVLQANDVDVAAVDVGLLSAEQYASCP